MNFEAHMAALPPSEAEAFRAIAGQLRSLREREPSPHLTDRILAAVDAERQHERRCRNRAPWWGVAAAAAALVAAVSYFWTASSAAPADPVQTGLAWLAANQEANGTWSPAKHGGAEVYRPALTALSALALDRDEKGRYAAQIQRACEALSGLQGREGAFGGEGRARLYNHAITTFALASLCPRHPALRPALDRALAYVGAQQTVQGGWDYEPNSEGNAALTSWQVRALACAEAQGFDAAKVPLRKGLRWLRSVTRDDGSIAYHQGSSARSDGLTALAAYALITAGKEFAGLQEIGRHAVGSLKSSPQASPVADCYRDYAKVMAFESAGDTAQADTVRRQMQTQKSQVDQWGSVGGKLYTAAFTVLAAR